MPSCCAVDHPKVDPERQPQDLTGRKWPQMVWLANYVALAAGWFLPTARPFLWSVGLAAAGVLCMVNAARCGRLHCHITGPLFLLGSLLTVLNASGVITVSWTLLGIAILAGVAIAYAPELIVGKYVRRTQPSAGEGA